MKVYTLLLVIHVAFGFTSLISGAIAMLVSKNYKWHKLSGIIYYYGMIGVFVTIVPMYLIRGNAILFLFLIGIFSLYLVLSGKRFLTLKNKAKNLRWYDYITVGVVFLTAIIMVGLGVYDLIVSRVGYGMIVLVFGSILLLNSGKDAQFLNKVRKEMKGLRKPLYNHISRMGGAYIATFTAFAVNNFSQALPYNLTWFLPGVVGSVLITLTIKRIKKREIEKRKSTTTGSLKAA